MKLGDCITFLGGLLSATIDSLQVASIDCSIHVGVPSENEQTGKCGRQHDIQLGIINCCHRRTSSQRLFITCLSANCHQHPDRRHTTLPREQEGRSRRYWASSRSSSSPQTHSVSFLSTSRQLLE